MSNKVECKKEKELGIISLSGDYQLELNLVSWNGKSVKYDLRRWHLEADGSYRPCKGVSLTAPEIAKLKTLLDEIL